MRKVCIWALLVIIIQGCSYKSTYQPIVFSDLQKEPEIIQKNNKYYAQLQKQDELLGLGVNLQTTKDQEVLVNKKHRDLYIIKHQGDTLLKSNTLLDISKVSNFRDMGGIVNQESKQVVWGKLYRSGALNKLSKKGNQQLRDLKITKVIDLRTDKEINKKPDKVSKDITYINLQAYQDSEDMFTKTRKQVLKGGITPEVADSLVAEFYGLYALEDPESMQNIIKTILDNPDSTLFHCSAGKDRTGMVSAIILSILKVDKQTILQEYLLSNNYRGKEVASRMKLAKFGKIFYPKINYQVVETFSWIKPEFLEQMFDQIDEKYGSMDNYIENHLQISPQQRELYLERYTYDPQQVIKQRLEL